MSMRPPERPPDEIDGLRLFEEPEDRELGRIVYQGRERFNFPEAEPHGVAHEYWFIERGNSGQWRLVHAIATFWRGKGYERHVSRLVGKYPSNERALDDLPTHLDEGIGNTVIETFEDGSIRFDPEFPKVDANYREYDDDAFDRTHDRCGTCAHYIPGGGCHFVQGEVDPGEYCEEFYANAAFFAHEHEGYVEVNADFVGPTWEADMTDIADFVDEIEERLQDIARQHQDERNGGY